jgi:hypothetical protein
MIPDDSAPKTGIEYIYAERTDEEESPILYTNNLVYLFSIYCAVYILRPSLIV